MTECSDPPSSFMIYSSNNAGTGKGKRYVLFHPDQSRWLVVNNTGLEIARYLDKGESVDDVALRLVKKYGISAGPAKRDVVSVFDQLSRQNFLNGNAQKRLVRTPSLNTLFFHLTNRCNLSCLQCYVSCPESNIKGDLPQSLVFQLIDELVDSGGQAVTFSGGEPLLHPGIKDILKYTAPKARVQLLTNGTLINREWAGVLADMKVSIQVGIDGSRREIHDAIRGRGNFDRAIKGIKYLQEAGFGKELNISTTITNKNIGDLVEIISLAERLEIPLVRFLPLRRMGSAETEWESVGCDLEIDDYEQFYRYVSDLQANRRCSTEVSCGLAGFLLNIEGQADDIWCPIGTNLVCWVNGDTYPCVLLMEDEYRLGNVFQDSLSKIINSDKMVQISEALGDRRIKIKRCAACDWRNFCQSGCMGQALDHKGTIWDTDNFCDYRKGRYRKAFDKILNKAR